MNRHQKIAWFNLIVIIIGIALIVLCPVAFEDPTKAFVFVFILGTATLIIVPLIFFRKKQGQVTFDERDSMIRAQSSFVGIGVAFGSLGGWCVSRLFQIGLNGSVPMSVVFFMYIGALISFIITKSLMVLYMYGWGQKDGGE